MGWGLLRAGACSLLIACLPSFAAASEKTEEHPVAVDDPAAGASDGAPFLTIDGSELDLGTHVLGSRLRVEYGLPSSFLSEPRAGFLRTDHGLGLSSLKDHARRSRELAAVGVGWGFVFGFASFDMARVSDPARWDRTMEDILGFVSARDKQLHFFASGALSLSVTALTGELRWGVLAALVVGLGKEVVWDHLLERGDPSSGDMLANALGVGFACLMTYLGELRSFP